MDPLSHDAFYRIQSRSIFALRAFWRLRNVALLKADESDDSAFTSFATLIGKSMATPPLWKDRSCGNFRQFDFVVPAGWTNQRKRVEQVAIIKSLENLGESAAQDEPEWLQLATRLPKALRQVLVAELCAGNRIAGIGALGWPNEGSIVVTMQERFSIARHDSPQEVTWRMLSDPHYAREEVTQRVDSTAFLLIA